MIMDLSSLALISAKIAAKVGLNIFAPGSGSSVDFIEAVVAICNGEYFSAGISAATGLLDIFTLGLWSSYKDVAKQAGKTAAQSAVKTVAKKAELKIFEAAVQKMARGLPKNAAASFYQIASKQVKKEIGMNFGKELRKGGIEIAVEQAANELTKRTFEDILRKGTVIGIVEGGTKDAIIAAIYTNVVIDSIEEILKTAPTESVKSVTTSAAKTAAKEYLQVANQNVLTICRAKSVVIGTVAKMYSFLR